MNNPYFDADYYLAINPDLAATVADLPLDQQRTWAEQHYDQYGATEGRLPNSWFDPAAYLAANPDLSAAGMTVAGALAHYAQYGWNEARVFSTDPALNPSNFDAESYAVSNPDVVAALGIADPTHPTPEEANLLLSHYLIYGIHEQREGGYSPPPVPDDGGGQAPITTFSLTASQDVLTPSAADHAHRTSGSDDVINGVTAALPINNTLNPGDQIDGGGGSDTLNIDVQASFSGFSVGGYLQSVENVNLTSSVAGPSAFDATGISDVETYAIKGWINLANLADTNATISLSDITSAATVSLGFGAATGSADDLSLIVNGLGAAAKALAPQETVTIQAEGIETLNLTTTGDNFIALQGIQIHTIHVLGDGGDLSTTVTAATMIFSAANYQGNIAVDLRSAGKGAVATVETGAGNDTITADVKDFAATAIINGGAGTDDRLELVGSNGSIGLKMSNVETISLGTSTDALGGNTTINGDISGLQTIEVQQTFGSGNMVYFSGMGAVDLGFNLLGNSAGTVTSDHTGTTAIYVEAGATATAAAPDSNGTDIKVSNSSDLTLTLTVGANTAYKGTIAAPSATSATLNTTGASTLTLDAASLNSLTANIGTDTALTVGNLANAKSVTLTGTGTATIGNLGSTTLGHGIEVNAADLQALAIGTINVGTSQTVNIDASTVAGNVSVGDITMGNGNAIAGTIGINVNGSTGNVNLGTLNANAIIVNASNALGAVTYGAMTVGKTLEINGAVSSNNSVTATVAGTSINAILNGGAGADSLTLTGAVNTLGYVVGGNVGDGANSILISAVAQTVTTTTVTINASGLTGTSGTVTIKGGAGADDITASGLRDVIYINSNGASSAASADVIQGFNSASGSGDAIVFTGGAAGSVMNYDKGSTSNYDLALAAAEIQINGTVTYSAQQVGNDLYVFYGTAPNVVSEVVQLVGVTLNTFDIGNIATAT